MIADVSYNDLVGTVSADITDHKTINNDLVEIGQLYGLDKTRFKLVGLSLYGVNNMSLSFICVDKQKSTEKKEHIVSLLIHEPGEDKNKLLYKLFKRLHIVLYEKYDKKYSKLPIDEELRFEDFHNS